MPHEDSQLNYTPETNKEHFKEFMAYYRGLFLNLHRETLSQFPSYSSIKSKLIKNQSLYTHMVLNFMALHDLKDSFVSADTISVIIPFHYQLKTEIELHRDEFMALYALHTYQLYGICEEEKQTIPHALMEATSYLENHNISLLDYHKAMDNKYKKHKLPIQAFYLSDNQMNQTFDKAMQHLKKEITALLPALDTKTKEIFSPLISENGDLLSTLMDHDRYLKLVAELESLPFKKITKQSQKQSENIVKLFRHIHYTHLFHRTFLYNAAKANHKGKVKFDLFLETIKLVKNENRRNLLNIFSDFHTYLFMTLYQKTNISAQNKRHMLTFNKHINSVMSILKGKYSSTDEEILEILRFIESEEWNELFDTLCKNCIDNVTQLKSIETIGIYKEEVLKKNHEELLQLFKKINIMIGGLQSQLMADSSNTLNINAQPLPLFKKIDEADYAPFYINHALHGLNNIFGFRSSYFTLRLIDHMRSHPDYPFFILTAIEENANTQDHLLSIKYHDDNHNGYFQKAKKEFLNCFQGDKKVEMREYWEASFKRYGYTDKKTVQKYLDIKQGIEKTNKTNGTPFPTPKADILDYMDKDILLDSVPPFAKQTYANFFKMVHDETLNEETYSYRLSLLSSPKYFMHLIAKRYPYSAGTKRIRNVNTKGLHAVFSYEIDLVKMHLHFKLNQPENTPAEKDLYKRLSTSWIKRINFANKPFPEEDLEELRSLEREVGYSDKLTLKTDALTKQSNALNIERPDYLAFFNTTADHSSSASQPEPITYFENRYINEALKRFETAETQSRPLLVSPQSFWQYVQTNCLKGFDEKLLPKKKRDYKIHLNKLQQAIEKKDTTEVFKQTERIYDLMQSNLMHQPYNWLSFTNFLNIAAQNSGNSFVLNIHHLEDEGNTNHYFNDKTGIMKALKLDTRYHESFYYYLPYFRQDPSYSIKLISHILGQPTKAKLAYKEKFEFLAKEMEICLKCLKTDDAEMINDYYQNMLKIQKNHDNVDDQKAEELLATYLDHIDQSLTQKLPVHIKLSTAASHLENREFHSICDTILYDNNSYDKPSPVVHWQNSTNPYFMRQASLFTLIYATKIYDEYLKASGDAKIFYKKELQYCNEHAKYFYAHYDQDNYHKATQLINNYVHATHQEQRDEIKKEIYDIEDKLPLAIDKAIHLIRQSKDPQNVFGDCHSPEAKETLRQYEKFNSNNMAIQFKNYLNAQTLKIQNMMQNRPSMRLNSRGQIAEVRSYISQAHNQYRMTGTGYGYQPPASTQLRFSSGQQSLQLRQHSSAISIHPETTLPLLYIADGINHSILQNTSMSVRSQNKAREALIVPIGAGIHFAQDIINHRSYLRKNGICLPVKQFPKIVSPKFLKRTIPLVGSVYGGYMLYETMAK